LLIVTDNAGMTVWHEAAREGNLDVLLEMWEWVNIILRTVLQSDCHPAVMQHR